MYIIILHNNARKVSPIVVLHKDTCEQVLALFLFGIVVHKVRCIRFRVGHFQVLDSGVLGIVDMNCCHILFRRVFVGLPWVSIAVDNRIGALPVSVYINRVVLGSCCLLKLKLLAVPCTAGL